MKIRRKIQLVYLVTLLPMLALVVGLTYAWYQSSLTALQRDRINAAKLVSTSFTAAIDGMAGAARVVGLTTLDRPPDSRTPERFTQLNEDFPLYWSAVADEKGKVLYASDMKYVGTTIRDPAITAAQGFERIALGDSRNYRGQVGFFMASAITDSHGDHQGLAIAFVDPVRLTDRLARNPILGGAHVVDASGHLVSLFEAPAVALTRPYWGKYPVVAQALAGHNAVNSDFLFPLTGSRRVFAAVPVNPFGWEAGTSIDRRVAFAPFNQSLGLSAAIAAVVVGISSIAAALVSFALLSSIDLLRLQAQQVGRPGAQSKVVRSGDEVEEVSRVLSHADSDLRAYIDGLEKMGDAAQRLSSALTTEDTRSAIIAASRYLFNASGVVVFLLNETTGLLEPAIWYSAVGAVPPSKSVAPGEPVAGRVFTTHQVEVVTTSIEGARPEWNRFREEQPDTSFVAAPLVPGGAAVGTLIIAAPGVENWTPEGREMRLLRAFAGHVATLVENARMYETERLVADILQQMLLTVPDEIEGVTFAVEYRSASHAARVGGDFYDLFEMRDGRIGIVIGDVAGKGLDASVMTSLVKNTVRAHADEPGKCPAEVIKLTSDLLLRESRPEAFVTLFVAYLDTATGDLVYSNAAHPTVGLIRNDGRLEALEATGSLVGALPNVPFEEEHTTMHKGSTLFMYTDGLTEARNEQGAFFGESRLFDLLSEEFPKAPQVIVNDVLGAVLEFTNNSLSDDLAIVTIRLDLKTGEDERERDARKRRDARHAQAIVEEGAGHVG